MTTKLYYDDMESPAGSLCVVSDGEKIVRIDYGTMDKLADMLAKWAARYFTEPEFIRSSEKTAHVKEELISYFNGERQNFSIPCKFIGTPFQKQVWQTLCDTIPYGETATYKTIAERIDNPKAVRAVGGAVNKNPFSIVVPCHRVIGSSGKMVGYNGGLDKKEKLLNLEKKHCDTAG